MKLKYDSFIKEAQCKFKISLSFADINVENYKNCLRMLENKKDSNCVPDQKLQCKINRGPFTSGAFSISTGFSEIIVLGLFSPSLTFRCRFISNIFN